MTGRIHHIAHNVTTYYRENRFTVWFFIVLWLSLSLITSNKDILYFSLVEDYDVTMPVLYLRGFLIWTLAACFVPLIILVARRFPVYDIKHRPVNILFHLIGSIAFLGVLALLFNIIFQLTLWQDRPFAETWLWVLQWYNLGAPVTYWFIIGGLFLHNHSRQYNNHHRRAIALQAELKEIQLRLLQMQLRPHFLFNALNTVSALLFEDRQAAAEILKKIKHYLELTLKETDRTEITLTEELFYTSLYLDIEKERYSDRLHTELHTDAGIKNAMVPNMLLQPLAENAIRHGIAREKNPGMLMISARRADNQNNLLLEIEDSGKGFEAAAHTKQSGLGIKNTLERLEKLTNGLFRFEIGQSQLGGCKISVEIPLKFPAHSAKISSPREPVIL